MVDERHSYYWQCPGPQKFLDDVLANFGPHGGKNVLLCRPRHAPQGLAGALSRRWAASQTGSHFREILNLPAVGSAVEPFAELVRGLGIRESECEDISALMKHERAQGKLFFVDIGEDVPRWTRWKAFLAQYSHAFRTRPVAAPAALCCSVTGRLGQCAYQLSDVALSVIFEYGICDLADMVAYASWRLRKTDILSPLQQQLAVAYAAHIALWDPDTCDQLIDLGWPRIFEPSTTLKEIAAQRQWLVRCAPANWYDGTENCFAGTDQSHSGFIIQSGQNEIHRRLLCAQLTVLLPHVEQRRPHIIKTLDRMLNVPYKDKDGRQIEEKHMLEVGHIENQLKKREHENRTRIRTDTRNEVSLLYDIRNSLSHLELFDHIRLSELESRFQPKEEQRIRARKPKD